MPFNSSTVAYAVAALALLLMFFQMRRKASPDKASIKIGVFDRFMYFLQSRASKVVVVSLVLNTMIAQLLYNSAGQLVLNNRFLLAYLIVSAASSTLAFALFEVSVIFQLHDLMALDESIKTEIKADKLINRGFLVLGISSLINFLSVFYFLALAWHTAGHSSAPFPLDNLPEPWNYFYYGFHALAYTAVLFMAGIFGERPKSSKEIVLATERALEQESMEAWKLQKQAAIAAMKKSGQSLSPVAAALGSPETATRVALLDLSMSGSITALEAAQAHIATGTAESAILDKLAALQHAAPAQADPSASGNRAQGPVVTQRDHSRTVDDAEDSEPLEDRTGRYSASDSRFAEYRLPAGITLLTEMAMTALAKRLGVPAAAVADAWEIADMTHHGPHGDQPKGTRNIATWQVLALHEMGLIDLPTNVSKRTLQAVQ